MKAHFASTALFLTASAAVLGWNVEPAESCTQDPQVGRVPSFPVTCPGGEDWIGKMVLAGTTQGTWIGRFERREGDWIHLSEAQNVSLGILPTGSLFEISVWIQVAHVVFIIAPESADEPENLVARAQLELASIAEQILLYRETRSSLPTDLSILLKAGLLRTGAKDPWGREYDYAKVSEWKFRLFSMGADPDSETDDIHWSSSKN